MILPIYILGNAVLKEKAQPISADYPNLHQLIQDMFDTMYNANGVGLAAPQVGLSIRLFVIDAGQFDEQYKDLKKVFINAEIVEQTGKEWSFNEGCLSIPDVRAEVIRLDTITIRYFDEHFQEHTETYNDIPARIIQHEYDHIEGRLFIDYISPFKKTLLRKKLDNLKEGKVQDIPYPVKFAKEAKKRDSYS
ncbi:MAG: peptide deformylase [Bacteroidia bacterium]|nr:peptide deformylase [Bacteroidia bacterium]MDW8345962.1 peptide deformylase [Bacteroidia bacterium]